MNTKKLKRKIKPKKNTLKIQMMKKKKRKNIYKNLCMHTQLNGINGTNNSIPHGKDDIL
jgi:hypothetical protein